jgi:hypothetical protein
VEKMLAKQSGSLVYVWNYHGLTLDEGKLILSLAEARQLRDTLIGLGYTLDPEDGDPEDG